MAGDPTQGMAKASAFLSAVPNERKLEPPRRRHISRLVLRRVADEVRRCGSLEVASEVVGVCSDVVRRHLALHADAREMMANAMRDATGKLRGSIYDRAQVSDKLAVRWMETYDPDWAPRGQAGTVRVTHTIAMTREQLAAVASKGLEPRTTVVESTQPLLTKPNDTK